MSFESTLGDLADPAKRLTSQQLTDLSDLDFSQAEQLEPVWADVGSERRLAVLTELADLAQDTVELNFDILYKLSLTDEEPAVRAAALRGLFEYEGLDLVGALAEVLRHDPDPDVRREAAMALGRFALAVELERIEEMVGDQVREILIESVEDEDEDDHVRARAIEAVGAISGEEIENLIESIYREESTWLKVGAVDAMGRNANGVWLPILLAETRSPAPEMRHAAAFALGEIGDEAGVEELKTMAIYDPDRDVQLVAIRALGEIGGQQARVALKTVLYEGDDELREAVQEAIVEAEFNDNPLGPSL